MRIVILAEWLANLGGCEHFTTTLSAALAGTGHEVVIALATGAAHPRWRYAAGGEVIAFAERPGAPADQLAALAERFGAELIHAIPYERTAFAYVERADRLPVVGTEPSDGGERCYWPNYDALPRLQRRFQALHVFSRRAARQAREHFGYPGPIARIPPTCRFDAALPLWRRDAPALRCALFGRVAVEKGITFAIDAFGTVLAAEWPALELDVWGDGELLPHLRQLATAAGAARRIHFRGAYPDLFRVPLEDYDFVLIPSYFEGLPYVFLECMWRGIPVVVTAHSGVPDLAGAAELCRFVTPGEQASLAAAVRSLYADFGRLHQQAATRRELVARHCDPAQGAAQFLDLYRQALHTR